MQRPRRWPIRSPIVMLAGVLAAAACVYRSVEVEPLQPDQVRSVETPVKVHLMDGSTIVYRFGLKMRGDTVEGRGVRFGPTLRDSASVHDVPLDSVVAMEQVRSVLDPGRTVGLTFATALATAVGVTAAAVAMFGSCPTAFSDSAGVPVLEAEGFSYSIARLFEARDLDRLRARADARGRARLEIRDEALETHYINHLELLEARHAAAETALPDARGGVLAVRDLGAPLSAADRAGRPVLAAVAAHDGVVYETAPAVTAAARPGDEEDWIDLELAAPAEGDSLALVFRMRNSLLATVLFYDLMLGDRGARALDWQARDLDRIGTAVELGRWAAAHLGLRIAAWDGREYRPVARVPDAGPVAWKDVGVLVPIWTRPVVRLRLSFPADGWRIDRIAGGLGRRPELRTVPLARVVDGEGREDAPAAAALRAADREYLTTTPGQRFFAEFDVGPELAPARTFLLAWQGYYVEWIRRGWLARGRDTTGFRPTGTALVEAIRRWQADRDSTERLFYATAIPVR